MQAASAAWKLEDGNSFPTNCFPARGVARKLHDGAGSWVVAYAEEQQSKFQALLKPSKHVHIQEFDPNNLKEYTAPSSSPSTKHASTCLSKAFLLQKHHVESVLDVCSVNVTDMNLEAVLEEDLKQFVNVAYVNAAENLLPFRPFTSFVNLRELELPVNGLRNLHVEYGDFPNLQVLDLSYNNLSSSDVLGLGILQKLKVLTLTGNGLSSIHTDMARPELVQTSENESEVLARFQSLEVLLLDDNRLSDLSTFASLAALPQLRELNLDKNGIDVIPHLKVVGDKVVSEAQSSIGHRKSAPSSGKKSRASRNSMRSGRQTNQPKTQESEDPQNKRNMATSTTSLNKPPEVAKVINNSDDNLPTPTLSRDDVSTPNPPFQQLRLLSIANNNIRDEECVLAVAAWPRLKHLVMHGNPIIQNNSGEPPLLSHYLRGRLGMNIHRFHKKSHLSKPHMVIPLERDRKVSSYVPKIPKQPVDVLINSLMGPTSFQPHPPPPKESTPRTPSPKEEAPPQQNDEKAPVEDAPPEQNVFLTQIDELPQPPTTQKVSVDKSPSKASVTKLPPLSPTPPVDEKYKGYEVLFNAKEDPELSETIGIQGNVRVLHQLLTHPTVFRSSDVTLDRVRPSYKAKKSRLRKSMAIAGERKVQKLPTKKEKFEKELEKMKKRDIVELEIPLSEALFSERHIEFVDEAEDLLELVEEKYRVAREESIRASRQAQRALDTTKEMAKTVMMMDPKYQGPGVNQQKTSEAK